MRFWLNSNPFFGKIILERFGAPFFVLEIFDSRLILEKMFCEDCHMLSKWFALDERLRFIVMASLNMVLRYGLFVVLGVVFGTLHYQKILLFMWLISSVIAFYSYKTLVFNTQGNHLKEYGKSVLIWILSYVINAFVLDLLVAKAQLNVYAAQAVAISFLLITNYLLFKHFAFRKPETLWSRWEKMLRVFDLFSK